MYIDPFWAGVFATVFAELALMFIASVMIICKRGSRHDS